MDLEDAAIIRRDENEKLGVTTPAHHAVAWDSLSGPLWGVLIGLLFLFPLASLVGVAGRLESCGSQGSAARIRTTVAGDGWAPGR